MMSFDELEIIDYGLEFQEKINDELYEESLCDTLEYYLSALSKDPSNLQLKEKFLLILSEWGKILEENEDYITLIDCYKSVLKKYPDEVSILNNFGYHLMRLKMLSEADFYFRKCLTINPDFLRAAYNLENLSLLSVERWHFKMLNDQQRNEAFREAIIKKINQGFNRVLDVGTGTGILSLCCLDGKAKEIYACDSSPIMIEIARQVFLSNNASDIKLIQKSSLELQIPEDISEKVSLLVTETFDVALLGEHVLLSLLYAWKHLLLPPYDQSEGLNSGKFGAVIPSRASVYATGIEFDDVANDFHLREVDNSCLFKDCNVLQDCSDYDSQNLSLARFICLTETEKIYDINFNDPSAIKEFLEGWSKNMTLKCKCSGKLDCFAIWFDLHLDENIILSTSPLSKHNGAWDQAICLLPRSILVREKQDLKITVVLKESNLKISLIDYPIPNDIPNFLLSECAIRLLNDEKLTKGLKQAADKLASTYSDSISILDCYSFPIFGLNFLKNRSSRFEDELSCVVSTRNDRALLSFMAEKYGIKIMALTKKKDNLLPRYFCCKRYDVILLDFFKTTGEIKDEYLLNLENLKLLLKPGGVIIPQQVQVIGQFIYSDWLTKFSKVVNDFVTCGYNIAEHINKYQVQEFMDFYFKSLGDDIAFSTSFELFSLFDSLESKTEMIVSCQSPSAFANAMVYWFKIKFTENCDEILTKDVTFYHQAAFIFSKIESKEIKFNIIRNDGLFCIKLLNI